MDTLTKLEAHANAGIPVFAKRTLYPDEWSRLQRWLAKHPEMRIQAGEVHCGKQFVGYRQSNRGGVYFIEPHKYECIVKKKPFPFSTRKARRGQPVTRKTYIDRWARPHARRAAEKGLPYTLDDDQLAKLFGAPCHYCGATPAKHNESLGIDRVDNSCGYEYDNCVPCCVTCNMLKRTLSYDDFVAQVRKIVNHLG